MRIRRKVNNCLNCGTALDGTYNFCPKCGQENNDNNVSFGTLLQDFFSNYFAFDSRFGKSVRPFLFQPGFLTNRYMEGKRMSYAHPLRVYLIVSLFYFFVCSMIVTDMLEGTDRALIEAEANARDLGFLDKEERRALRETLSAKSMDDVLNDMESSGRNDFKSLSKAIQENTTPEERAELQKIFNQAVSDSLGISTGDSLIDETLKKYDLTPKDAPVNTSLTVDSASGFLIFEKMEKIYDLSKNDLLTPDEIIDSVKTDSLSRFERYTAVQGIRIMRAEKAQVGAFIVKNLPIMMLVLIPLFALILKLLYVRRNFLYINHVIHAFHLHSFAYFIYGITLIFTYFIIESDGLRNTINFLIFVAVTTYAYASFLRVYKQGWFKTLIKFNLVGFIYFNLIISFFILEMFVSFLLY